MAATSFGSKTEGGFKMMKRRPTRILALSFAFLLCLFSFSACAAGGEDSVKERLRAQYGENRVITEGYDAALAVGCRSGVFVGRLEDGVLAHKGIPYAKAPTGSLRWKPPVPAPDSDTVREALYFGPSPIQSEWPSEVGSYYPQSEDCLTLNVWSNPGDDSENKPVMVFFHGGSYGWGAVSDPLYDGHNLIKKFGDVILVTVEYRLGLFGFIDFSAVPGGEDYRESGNLGLLDQVCALQWVQRNIAAFGGDPENVTIFGESAGGGSVSLLPLVRGTQGLFRRVIAESGSVNLTYSKEECRLLTELLLKETGCSTMAELTALSEERLREVNEKLNDYNNFPERDGVVLPEDPYAAYAAGATAGLDLMLGTNADEVRYWIYEMGYYTDLLDGLTIYRHGMEVMLENNMSRLSEAERNAVDRFLALQNDRRVWNVSALYTELLFRLPALRQAELHARNGGRVYNYLFTYLGADETVGACHAMELAYVFDNLDETIYTGGHVDPALAETVQTLWVAFARTGNPRTESLVWEPYTAGSRSTLVLGETVETREDLGKEARELLSPLLGHYFNGCYSQLSLFVPHVFKLAGLFLAALLAAVLLICLTVRAFRRKKRKAQDP